MKIHLTDNNFNKSSAVAEIGDHLATIDMGRKVGAAVPKWRHLAKAYEGEGLVWLIGAVVCSLAAAAGPRSFSAGSG